MASLEIAWDALSATASVLVAGAAGFVIVHQKIVPENFASSLSNYLFKILLPLFSFLNIAQAVSAEKLLLWWPLILLSLLQVLLSYAVGETLFRLFAGPRLPAALRRILSSTVAMQNSGNLPFVYFTSVVRSSAVFTSWTGPGSEVDPGQRMIVYISIYVVAWNVVAWTWSFQRMGPPRRESEIRELQRFVAGLAGPHAPPQLTTDETSISSVSVDPSESVLLTADRDDMAPADRNAAAAAACVEMSAVASMEAISTASHETARDSAAGAGAAVDLVGSNSASRRRRWRQIVPPPVIGTMVGLCLGLIPFTKNHLFVQPFPVWSGVLDGMHVLSASFLGCAMAVLGCNIALTHRKRKEQPLAKMSLSRRWLLLAVLGRLIVVPLVSCGLVLVLWKVDFLFPVKDPAILFFLLAETACPGAAALQMQANLHNFAVDEVSLVLFFQYMACTGTMTAWVALFLALIPSIV